MRKPVIGITAALMLGGGAHCYKVNDDYLDAILRAGGLPVLLAPTDIPSDQRQMMELADGLLIPGGVDSAPCFYGEEPTAAVNHTDRRLDRFEIAMVRLAQELDKPVLGICRGHQLLNIVFGGTLFQDIPTQVKGAVCHEQRTPSRDEPFHGVTLKEDSLLAKIMGETKMEVNTFHHQAVKDLARALKAAAHTSDGLVEALEGENGKILGVQWHPEGMSRQDPTQQRLFDGFVRLCAGEKV